VRAYGSVVSKRPRVIKSERKGEGEIDTIEKEKSSESKEVEQHYLGRRKRVCEFKNNRKESRTGNV